MCTCKLCSDEEKLITNRDCTHCGHEKVCRHRDDYLEFINAINEFSEKYFGDKICEDVASVEVSCNYFTYR